MWCKLSWHVIMLFHISKHSLSHSPPLSLHSLFRCHSERSPLTSPRVPVALLSSSSVYAYDFRSGTRLKTNKSRRNEAPWFIRHELSKLYKQAVGCVLFVALGNGGTKQPTMPILSLTNSKCHQLKYHSKYSSLFKFQIFVIDFLQLMYFWLFTCSIAQLDPHI